MDLSWRELTELSGEAQNILITMLISTGGKDEKAKSGALLTQNLEPGVIMVGLKSLKCHSSVFHSGCLDFIKTAWDRELDAASLLPGKYTFEKYVTGAFLGDLARRVLLGVLANLGTTIPPCFSASDSLSTANLSEIVAASLPGGQRSSLLENLEKEVAAILTFICILLSERAALMVAVPMATFLNR